MEDLVQDRKYFTKLILLGMMLDLLITIIAVHVLGGFTERNPIARDFSAIQMTLFKLGGSSLVYIGLTITKNRLPMWSYILLAIISFGIVARNIFIIIAEFVIVILIVTNVIV